MLMLPFIPAYFPGSITEPPASPTPPTSQATRDFLQQQSLNDGYTHIDMQYRIRYFGVGLDIVDGLLLVVPFDVVSEPFPWNEGWNTIAGPWGFPYGNGYTSPAAAARAGSRIRQSPLIGVTRNLDRAGDGLNLHDAMYRRVMSFDGISLSEAEAFSFRIRLTAGDSAITDPADRHWSLYDNFNSIIDSSVNSARNRKVQLTLGVADVVPDAAGDFAGYSVRSETIVRLETTNNHGEWGEWSPFVYAEGSPYNAGEAGFLAVSYICRGCQMSGVFLDMTPAQIFNNYT